MKSFLTAFSRRKPIIHLYSIVWNEEIMLPYFFRHYDEIVDRYVFFDDGSTDNTLKILNSHPNVEVRSLPRLDADSFVLAENKVHNNCWKESKGKADWVIIAEVDEHIYHKNLLNYIYQCQKKGVTLIPGVGDQMLSCKFPDSKKKLTKLITRGSPFTPMNKLSLLNPNKIIGTGYSLGKHEASPVGEVVYPIQDELLNLHYKYLSLEWTYKRHAELKEKLGSIDKENRWGFQYFWTKEELKKSWEHFRSQAV